ncbi:MAG: bifunctional methionine sulfoxide reductase B/A protein [Rickettsiaceae bacterium]|nr:MAG: bifunctional methionine sulfoxide reductase B/A protein [Rickettsiaceae bacterium]
MTNKNNVIKTSSLTPFVRSIVIDKDTEYCGTGAYNQSFVEGTYLCKNCGLALFSSTNKFHSNTGWPSFDRELEGSVKKLLDNDGVRTEILCARCNGHLGHIFYGEQLTKSNTRYCLNSASIEFVPIKEIKDTGEAILAAGCFWGVEYYFNKLKGVVKTEVGYTGGQAQDPSYQLVCSNNNDHVEAIRVIYDTSLLSYEQIIKYFYEIHDFTQVDGQGNDIGIQYLSTIFYYNQNQYDIALATKNILATKGYAVATQLRPVSTFWPAESYHQEYYNKNNDKPYCHLWKQIF